MSPRGVTHRVPPNTLPEEREVCPRCRAGVVRLGRIVVCGELSCDWSRRRFAAARPAPPVAATPRPPREPRSPRHAEYLEGKRVRAEEQRGLDEQALLQALAGGGGTIRALADRAELKYERARELLCGSLRHRVIRSRIRQSQTAHFALREEAIAC